MGILPPAAPMHPLPRSCLDLLAIGLVLAVFSGGCESARARAGHHQAESPDDESIGPPANRHSAMLEKLRESNREAIRSDQQDDVESMRRELAKVEIDLAQAEAGSEGALALQAHRDELRLQIEQQERMVKGLGE